MGEIYNGNGKLGHCLLASKQTEIGRLQTTKWPKQY
jgi:hypothetical protein